MINETMYDIQSLKRFHACTKRSTKGTLQWGRLSGSLRFWGCILLVFLIVNEYWVFRRSSLIIIGECGCWRKGGIDTRSEHRTIYVRCRILPSELYVFQIARNIVAAGINCSHRGQHFVPHFHCSLLIWSYWHLSQMILQESLPLVDQRVESGHRDLQ